MDGRPGRQRQCGPGRLRRFRAAIHRFAVGYPAARAPRGGPARVKNMTRTHRTVVGRRPAAGGLGDLWCSRREKSTSSSAPSDWWSSGSTRRKKDGTARYASSGIWGGAVGGHHIVRLIADVFLDTGGEPDSQNPSVVAATAVRTIRFRSPPVTRIIGRPRSQISSPISLCSMMFLSV